MSAGSVCSYGSQGIRSQGSSGSKKSKGSNYRTVSYVSHIDENLFGEPNHIKLKKNNQNVERTPEETNINVQIRNENLSKELKEEQVRVVTKDMVRHLRVPREDPSLKSMVIHYGDYERLRERSKFISAEENIRILEEVKAKKEIEMNASQERRQEMKRLDLIRKNNDKLTDLEEEAYHKAQVLLKKAMEQRQEQEDEIKKLNELITNAKIQAIRDAQIAEKGIIKREGEEEEQRLDKMMEIDRINAIIMQDHIERRRKEEEMYAASAIIQQIEENEQDKLIELERKDQENNIERQRIAVLMEEEIAKRRHVRARQENLREELNRANVDMLSRKTQEKELEKLLDMRVLEIQKEKATREAEFEAEAQRIKAEKEKEVARLRGLQERARDEQAERDELRARRAMEDAEREWRRKELEEAEKKKDIEDELKRARSDQAEMKEHFLAIQAARDRAEFERTLRVQKELMEREKELDEFDRKKRTDYSKDIRYQIRKNEETKIAERNAFFKEGEKIAEESRLRKVRLEEAKNRKLQELKDAGISEKFLKQIERKIQQSQQL